VSPRTNAAAFAKAGEGNQLSWCSDAYAPIFNAHAPANKEYEGATTNAPPRSKPTATASEQAFHQLLTGCGCATLRRCYRCKVTSATFDLARDLVSLLGFSGYGTCYLFVVGCAWQPAGYYEFCRGRRLKACLKPSYALSREGTVWRGASRSPRSMPHGSAL
jgi:hypothetical protein